MIEVLWLFDCDGVFGMGDDWVVIMLFVLISDDDVVEVLENVLVKVLNLLVVVDVFLCCYD